MTIRTFRTRNFTVTVHTEEDYDVDLSWDDTGEVRAKIDSGEFQHFGVRAAVEYNGMTLAENFLGGCIYADPMDFMDHKGMNAGGYGSYFSDMVRTVCKEARGEFQRMKEATEAVHLRP